MNKWISRILVLIFFVNSMPLPTWAARSRRANKRECKVQEVVNTQTQKYQYDAWKEEIADYNAILKGDDLSPEERQFTQLNLQIAQLNVEYVDALEKTPLDTVRINAVYQAKVAVPRIQAENLEKQLMLRDFYQIAQSDHYIAASVYAMHQHAQNSAAQYQRAKAHSERLEQQTFSVPMEPEGLVHQPDAVQANTSQAQISLQRSSNRYT